MANNPLINPENESFLPVPADLSLSESNTVEEAVVEISSQIQDIIGKLNGKLSLGTDENSSRAGNLDVQRLTIVFPGSANAERKIPHGLGRVPVGYWPVRKDRACDIYDSTETGWTEKLFSLKCSVADATVDLLVF